MLSLFVKDYMQANVQAIKSSADVREVVAHLLKNSLSGAPVIDDTNALVGFVSEQDCMKDMLNSSFYREETALVTSIMRTDVLTVSPDASILEIAETMLGNKPKIYPVVERGKLVGLITRRMILQALSSNSGSYFSHQSPRPAFAVTQSIS